MSLVDDQEKILRDCTERFDRLGIEYMLTGSIALVHYTVGRMTKDIDIVIELSESVGNLLIKEFEPEYYVPHGRVRDAIRRKFMFNLLHQETLVKVDCIIRKETEFQRAAFSNRSKMIFGEFEVWTISKEDLILSKLHWAKDSKSEMQMRDVANMLRTKYDEDYVRNWAKKLGVEAILAECIEMLK